MRKDGVLIVAGATGSGKTELAIELARLFDAEIVGADSRQVYRDMPIGTAAPTPAQRAAVPHHLVGFLDPNERYSAARFAVDALAAIDGIHARGKRALVVGGTGFYLRALMGGVALAAEYDDVVRARLAREATVHSPQFLHAWLAQRDARRAAALHPSDSYRIVRALEVALSVSPEPRQSPTLRTRRLSSALIFLDLPWHTIDERIERRARAMIADGLLDEAERVGEAAVAANAVGYPQAIAYRRGWCTRAELLSALERASRRYARRQRAWFRSEPSTLWLAPEAVARAAREKLHWSTKRG